MSGVGAGIADARGASGPDPSAGNSWRARGSAVALMVWSARLVGLLTVVSAVTPVLRRRLHPTSWFSLPLQASVTASIVVAAAGVGLVLLATGLRRRKRRAWQLGVALCVLIILSHLVGRPPLVPTVVAAVLVTGLLLTRREFTALPDPVGRWVAMRIVVQLLVAGFGLVTVLLRVRPQLLVGRPSLGEQLTQAGLSLVGVSGPVVYRDVAVARDGEGNRPAPRRRPGPHGPPPTTPPAGRWRSATPSRQPRPTSWSTTSPLEWLEELTAALGPTFGVGALVLGGYFLLRSAEPRPRLSAEEVSKVRDLLSRHGGADSLGYFALRSDKSAVFSSTGKSAVTYRVLVGVALASGDPLGDAEAWPGAITEFLTVCRRYGWAPAVLGCSQVGARAWSREGGLDALELGDEAVIEAETFTLQFVPWGTDGLSLDLMIRDPAVVDNGVNELLIADLLGACRTLDVSHVSLNFAVFRAGLAAGERIGAGPVARLWARLLRIASRWWQIETLYRFNARFNPEWVPRFLVFGAVRDLPRIAVAAFEAEGYGGRPPALLRLLHRAS